MPKMIVAYLKSAFFAVVAFSLFCGGQAFSQGLKGLAVGEGGAVIDEVPHSGSYVFWGGEEVRINVFGESELSGTYTINDMGRISFPLIGGVSLRGLTAGQAKALIETRLADGYLKKPNVFVEPVSHREFYVVGAVRMPGSYDYREGMTIFQAIESAGGFDDAADQKRVQLLRPRKGRADLYEEKPVDAAIEPGDIILAKEK